MSILPVTRAPDRSLINLINYAILIENPAMEGRRPWSSFKINIHECTIYTYIRVSMYCLWTMIRKHSTNNFIPHKTPHVN